MWRLIYKSAAARLESFSDNSSFPQIDDELFIAPLSKRGEGLYIGLRCLSFRPFVHPFVCSSVKISSYSPALKRGGGAIQDFGCLSFCPLVHPSVSLS